MSATTERSADWMWKIMEEATEELRKRPAWEVEMLRNAPRMYPSLRQDEAPIEIETPTVPPIAR